MSEPRAILATFSDWRPVKSRKVLQLVFEVPVEHTQDVLTKLGAPMPHEEKWCGIALLDAPVCENVRSQRAVPVAAEAGATSQVAGSAKPKRHFDELPLSAQASLLCKEERFRQFLRASGYVVQTENDAADTVRSHCRVKSRGQLNEETSAAVKWIDLYGAYQSWLLNERYPDQVRK